jgi:rSAM/selenodomain-associated transferase 1
VTLWAAPDENDLHFQAARDRHAVKLARQSEGDLGARMFAALSAEIGPVLVIGTDCPALTSHHLRSAADVLCRGTDAVVLPAEDGGYVLIGMRARHAAVFEHMCWGTARVLGETRRRLKRLGLTWQEPAMLWDLDLPADIKRLRAIGLHHLVA